jgi:hypothetical protein
MPNYGYVHSRPACPRCGSELTDLVSFQWGYLPGYQPRDGQVYEVGDAIRWRLCDGVAPPWTFFRGVEDEEACNAGDPTITDLYAFDLQQAWLAEPCRVCHASMDGAAVEIRGGIITRAAILMPGEVPRADAVDGLLRINADGTYDSLPSPLMAVRAGCGPIRFSTARDPTR